jgi:hypothetical protein
MRWWLVAAFILLTALLLPALKVPAEGPEDPHRGGALKVPVEGAGDMTYRLEYGIRGGAISRLLLFFPIRVFYEASAAVDLAAHRQPDGSICFTYAHVPRTAYILRTLGFSGKTLGLLTVGGDEENMEPFAEDLLSRWSAREPEFAARAKTVKKFPHRLEVTGPQPFVFLRDRFGFYREATVGLEPRYRYAPAKIGIYFNVFPMLAELLELLNHRFLPPTVGPVSGPLPYLPAEWTGDELDFSAELNRAAGLLEKVVKSLITVKQKFPFRLRFRVVSRSTDEMEICGECFPDVPLWKGFMIREVIRRLRLRPADGALLADEIWMGLRNSKGHGGYGCLRLRRIDTMEENQ